MNDLLINREITFNKEEHRYFYKGKELSGVTHIVSKRVGKEFSAQARSIDKVMTYARRGTRLHELAEDYFRNGTPIVDSKDARYIAKVVDALFPASECLRIPEMLVSDHETVATAIDLVVVKQDNTVVIFDYKTGNFDREYCSWQLGFGKYLFEFEGGYKVSEAYVIATKEPFMYKITPKAKDRVLGRIEAFRKMKGE